MATVTEPAELTDQAGQAGTRKQILRPSVPVPARDGAKRSAIGSGDEMLRGCQVEGGPGVRSERLIARRRQRLDAVGLLAVELDLAEPGLGHVLKAKAHGFATRAVDDIVKALGMGGVLKSDDGGPPIPQARGLRCAPWARRTACYTTPRERLASVSEKPSCARRFVARVSITLCSFI